jgi:hypothetical protein
MRRLKAGSDVIYTDSSGRERSGSILFSCAKESFMLHLDDGDNVGPIHKSALKLKPEPPAQGPRAYVLEDE